MTRLYTKTKNHDRTNTNAGVKESPYGRKSRRAESAGGFSRTSPRKSQAKTQSSNGDLVNTQVWKDNRDIEEYDYWIQECFKEWEKWVVQKEADIAALKVKHRKDEK